MGNEKAQAKGKKRNRGKGKAKGNQNPVRDGSPKSAAPVREQAAGRNGADHWDDLRRAWAGYLSQQPESSKGGGHQPHHPNQRQQNRHRHEHHHHHPGSQQAESGSVQSRRNLRSGSGGNHAHTDRKRKAMATDGTAGDGVERAAKRRKGNSGPSGRGTGAGAGGAAAPHPDFWHPDGSVIVEVGRTQFKLHQSTLQRHSAYFADAFREKEGHPSGGSRTRLPVYRVDETTAEDFASLLTVIEEPMKYGEDSPPMPVLAGVLRAARALSFGAQRKWAERMLGRTWSAALGTLTANPMPHAAEALAFARSYGLLGVQKRASYELLRVPTFGQTIIAAAAEAKIGGAGAGAAGANADAGASDLSRADLLRFLHAREQLSLAWAEAAGKAPTDFACPRSTQTQTQTQSQSERSGASGGGSCASANVDRVHARWAELVHSSGLYVERMVDPLMGLQGLVEISWKDEGFCKKCVSARRNAWEELRRKLWEDLDVWLELNVEKVD